jgi:hypothetical protein
LWGFIGFNTVNQAVIELLDLVQELGLHLCDLIFAKVVAEVRGQELLGNCVLLLQVVGVSNSERVRQHLREHQMRRIAHHFDEEWPKDLRKPVQSFVMHGCRERLVDKIQEFEVTGRKILLKNLDH